MAEMLVLVDGNDRQVGTEEKVRCHLPDGLLHRAFTALLFDQSGRLALGRRSPSKMLWPNDWDGTFASHPRVGEGYEEAGLRRMPEELGVSCRLDYMLKFEYHVAYRDIGSENEVCATLVGTVPDKTRLDAVPEEISEVRWAGPEELLRMLRDDPASCCPWMIAALYLLPSSGRAALERHHSVLEGWMGSSTRAQLAEALEKHMPDDSWRLVQ